MGKERKASSPAAGGVRDVVRTVVAFAVAFLFMKLGGAIPGVDLAGMQEAIVVILVSGIMAFMGKSFRSAGKSVGKIM